MTVENEKKRNERATEKLKELLKVYDKNYEAIKDWANTQLSKLFEDYNVLVRTLSKRQNFTGTVIYLFEQCPRFILDVIADNPDKVVSCLIMSFVPSWVEFRNLSINNISKFEDLLLRKKKIRVNISKL